MVSLRTFLPSLFVFKVSALLRGKLSHGLYLNRRFCLNLRSCNVKNKIDIWIKCFCLYLETQKLFSPDLVWHREIDIIATLFILLLFLNWKKKKKAFHIHQWRKRRYPPESALSWKAKGLIYRGSTFAHFSLSITVQSWIRVSLVFLLPFVFAMKFLPEDCQEFCKNYTKQKLVERWFWVPGKLTLSSRSTDGFCKQKQV